MEEYTTTLHSRVDGLPLSVLEVIPDSEIRGVVQLVHGMTEHKERYLPFMEYMAGRGFVCVIHDHRGHGKSLRSSGDRGYMYGGRGESLVQDIRRINAYARVRYPGKPLILFGHSMGSLAVRAYLKRYDRHIKAAIICGSPSKTPALPFGRALAAVQKCIFGGRHPAKLIEKLSFGPYAARFAGEKSAFAWTCSNPDVVAYYEASPDCGFTFTVDGYQALFDLMRETYSEKGWKCQNPKLPILFVSGGDDPCMGSVRGFKKAVDHMRFVGYRNVRGKIYPGMRHEILNETDREKVFRDIYCFVRKNL